MRKKIDAVLCYEGITAEFRPKWEKFREEQAGLPRFVPAYKSDLIYTKYGKRPLKGYDGWSWRGRASAFDRAYCVIEKGKAGRPWQEWDYKAICVDEKGEVCAETDLETTASIFIQGEYVFILYRGGKLEKFDLSLRKLASITLAQVDLNYAGKMLESDKTFCFKNNRRFSEPGITIVNYESMSERIVPCPKGFTLEAADAFGYIYGEKGLGYSTVTVLGNDGSIIEKIRLKGNISRESYFRYGDRVYVTTCTLGIHEFIGTREDETVTRVYRFEPEGE